MKKAFIIDLSVCNGCYCCQIACKDEHVANDWSPYAKPQPDTGQFWVKVDETVRGTVPKVKVSYIPKMCLHCDDAECIKVCRYEAISRREDGLVIIDPAKCAGCKLCADYCPHGMIYFNEGLNLAQKCTGCAHLLDDGWDVPRCVDNCPTGALKFGDESVFAEEIAKAEYAGNNCKGRVYYLNRPKKFIAGTVYDPIEKEVVIGASCTLKDKDSGQEYKEETDNFGDFWFKELPVVPASYDLSIVKGAASVNINAIDATLDVNLGDIPMKLT
jgi:Fe-S-cluster-containing dehydrogenase component